PFCSSFQGCLHVGVGVEVSHPSFMDASPHFIEQCRALVCHTVVCMPGSTSADLSLGFVLSFPMNVNKIYSRRLLVAHLMQPHKIHASYFRLLYSC
ncbi:hypothetical protein Taro_044298, partial [Colocasia esculenta]|nr:hypothetical protein [Colocasia esculenta]